MTEVAIETCQGLPALKIIVRGGGDMATGTACRLYRSGFRKILMTELEHPLAVRRLVSFCEALYSGSCVVEDVAAVRIGSPLEASKAWDKGMVPVVVDPENTSKDVLNPDVVIDATLAKKNLGTSIKDATLVIALGPGFYAGQDVHCVVETNRGHYLGRLLFDGAAEADTGIPGPILGQTARRVIRAPQDGIFESDLDIGAMVKKGQVIGRVSGSEVKVELDGILRGLIKPHNYVSQGLKIGDVDPRGDAAYCSTISDKARAVSGSVLEAILMRFNTPKEHPRM